MDHSCPLPESLSHYKSLVLVQFVDQLSAHVDQLLQTTCDITLSQFKILVCLQIKKTKTQSELSSLLSISAPAVSRLVDTLQFKKFLKKEPLPEDQRVQICSITKQGAKQLKQAHKLITDFETELYKQISTQQLQELHSTVHTLLSRLTPLN